MLAYRVQVEGYFRGVVGPQVAIPPRVSASKDDLHITEHLSIYGYAHTLSTLTPPAAMELGHSHTLKSARGRGCDLPSGTLSSPALFLCGSISRKQGIL